MPRKCFSHIQLCSRPYYQLWRLIMCVWLFTITFESYCQLCIHIERMCLLACNRECDFMYHCVHNCLYLSCMYVRFCIYTIYTWLKTFTNTQNYIYVFILCVVYLFAIIYVSVGIQSAKKNLFKILFLFFRYNFFFTFAKLVFIILYY